MTDFTCQPGIALKAGFQDVPLSTAPQGAGKDATGFFARPGSGLLRDLVEDFRAVPGEAWIILAVSAVLSNLFIALA